MKEERLNIEQADVAQLAEHILGKDEVTSSILVVGSSNLLAGSTLRRSLSLTGLGEVCTFAFSFFLRGTVWLKRNLTGRSLMLT